MSKGDDVSMTGFRFWHLYWPDGKVQFEAKEEIAPGWWRCEPIPPTEEVPTAHCKVCDKRQDLDYSLDESRVPYCTECGATEGLTKQTIELREDPYWADEPAKEIVLGTDVLESHKRLQRMFGGAT